MNHVFRLVNPVLDRNMFIFKVSLFIKRAKYEENFIFYYSLRIFNMWGQLASELPRLGEAETA